METLLVVQTSFQYFTSSYIVIFIAINNNYNMHLPRAKFFFLLLLFIILKFIVINVYSFPSQNRPFNSDNNKLIIDLPKSIDVNITTMISICVQ